MDDPLTDTIHLNFWDYDKIKMNDFLGQITVPVMLAVNAEKGVYDHMFDLKSKKEGGNKQRGSAHIILTYIDSEKRKNLPPFFILDVGTP